MKPAEQHDREQARSYGFDGVQAGGVENE